MTELNKCVESMERDLNECDKMFLHVSRAKFIVHRLGKQQQEREQGCEHCKHTDIIAGESSIDGEITADLRLDVEDYNSLDVIVCRDGGTLFDFSVDIKYCPMCGTDLRNAVAE